MCGCHCHPTPSTLEAILSAILRLEATMATTAEQIREMSAKHNQLTQVTSDILTDFRAFRDRMQTELAQAIADREQPTEAIEAALAEANERIDAARNRLGDLDVEVGDADGSDTPVDPTPEQPGEGEQPVDNGDPNTNR